MNYTKAQLQAMPNLPGSTSQSELKVSNDTTRVWLMTQSSKLQGTKLSVVIETKQDGKWLPVKRYPV